MDNSNKTKLGAAITVKMRNVAKPVDIEGTIRRIRNAPAGASLEDIVTSLRRDGISADIIFLCYKAANILDNAASEFALRRALLLADTDPPPPFPEAEKEKT